MSLFGNMADRGRGELIKKEDANWGCLRFSVDESVKLPDSEIVTIIAAALESFTFGGFSSLEEMLSTLGVTLVISPATPTRIVPSGISEWVLYW